MIDISKLSKSNRTNHTFCVTEENSLTINIKNLEWQNEYSIFEDKKILNHLKNKILPNNVKYIVFQNCKFQKIIFNSVGVENIVVEFKECTFNEEIEVKNYKPAKQSIFFNKCNMENSRLIFRGHYGTRKSKDDTRLGIRFSEDTTIGAVIIADCSLYGKLHFTPESYPETETDKKQKFTVQKFHIYNSTFYNNFKLHCALIKEFCCEDVNFEKQANFYMCEFGSGPTCNDNNENCDELIFHAINFNGLAIFEECIFNQKLTMNYVTFNEISQFRKATFMEGLDLDNTNIQKHINFFGIKGLFSIQGKENTSQETYRIIKYNFQQVGNTIQVNKYHALELEKYHDWLKNNKKGHRQSLLAIRLHYISSKYSREWIQALSWILGIGLFFAIVENTIELLGDDKSIFLEYIKTRGSMFFKDWGKYLWLPYSYSLEGQNFWRAGWLMLNKITLAYLYYQLITAFRKDTKK